MKIPFYKPSLPPYDTIKKDVEDMYRSGMLAPSVYTNRFQEAVKEYLGVKYAVAFSNASDALMCLVAYIKHMTGKSKVISPGFTFAATWQSADWNGMESLIADVNEHGCIDIKSVERLLQKYPGEIACIIGVHVFGYAADVDELKRLSIQYGVPVIYDAAHGFGALYGWRPLGNNGLAEVFSIGTTKPLAAGEGGVVTTNDPTVAEAMYMAAMHGHKYGDLDVELTSLNGRIQEFNSIVAYHGLSYLDECMGWRWAAVDNYSKHFPMSFGNDKYDVCVSAVTDFSDRRYPSFKDYTIQVKVFNYGGDFELGNWINPKNTRDFICEYLENEGIGTKKYYYPCIPELKVRSINKTCEVDYEGDVPNYKMLADGCISIPFFVGITEEEQKYVISKLQEALSKCI